MTQRVPTIPTGQIRGRRNQWEFRVNSGFAPGDVRVQYYATHDRGLIECDAATKHLLLNDGDAAQALLVQMEEAVIQVPKAIVQSYGHYAPVAKPRDESAIRRNRSHSELRDLKGAIATLLALLNGVNKPMRPEQVEEFTRKYAAIRDEMKKQRDMFTQIEAAWEMLGAKLVDTMGDE